MKENTTSTSIFKVFPILFILIILASFGGVPYAKDLLTKLPADAVGYIPPDSMLGMLFVIQLSVVTVLGLILSEKVSLGAPVLEAIVTGKTHISWSSMLLSSGIIGFMLGSLLLVSDYVFYRVGSPLSFFTTELPPWYKGLVGSFFGGIGEELIYRLFFMTLLVWIINLGIRNKGKTPKAWTVWAAMIIAAILFSLAHLPIASSLSEVTMIVATRGILLNGIAGIGFGYLYWKKGLLFVMIAHFTADITLHVIAVLLFG